MIIFYFPIGYSYLVLKWYPLNCSAQLLVLGLGTVAAMVLALIISVPPGVHIQACFPRVSSSRLPEQRLFSPQLQKLGNPGYYLNILNIG